LTGFDGAKAVEGVDVCNGSGGTGAGRGGVRGAFEGGAAGGGSVPVGFGRMTDGCVAGRCSDGEALAEFAPEASSGGGRESLTFKTLPSPHARHTTKVRRDAPADRGLGLSAAEASEAHYAPAPVP
jgi:hypothetical protein